MLRAAAALLLLLAPALAVDAAPRRQPARAATVDWTTRVAAAPGGGMVMGNPAAKAKLVEYSSFTCSHCAAFQKDSKAGLMPLIKAGKVSWEVRTAIRDRFDLAAALLVRCQGPSGFFRASDAVFAAQPQWLGKAAALPEPAATTTMNDTLAAVARGVGLDRLAVPGLAPARVNACIVNQTEQATLARMRDEAWNERRISGTPAFLVNGQAVADVYDWAGLEPVLRAALAR